MGCSMSAVTVIGIAFTAILAVCSFVFLKCVAFASNSGRHALRARVDVSYVGPGDAVCVQRVSGVVDHYGVYDDFPSPHIGARPYLEYFWRVHGRGLVDDSVEFSMFYLGDEHEYAGVSGQLELAT